MTVSEQQLLPQDLSQVSHRRSLHRHALPCEARVGGERRFAGPRGPERGGILNGRPARSAVREDPDHLGEISDHHRENGDHVGAKRVITLARNDRSRSRETRTEEAGGLPEFVLTEVREYLRCGLLEFGKTVTY
jgi:hypothetical protein